MTTRLRLLCAAPLFILPLVPLRLDAQTNESAWQSEWKNVLDAARTGARAAMREQLDQKSEERSGIGVDMFAARGSIKLRRTADEGICSGGKPARREARENPRGGGKIHPAAAQVESIRPAPKGIPANDPRLL